MRYPTPFPMQGPDVRGILTPKEILTCMAVALGVQAVGIQFINAPDARGARYTLEERGLNVREVQEGVTFGRPVCKGLYATRFTAVTKQGETRTGVVCRNAFSSTPDVRFDPK